MPDDITNTLTKTIPLNYALKHRVLPLKMENGAVYVALTDTTNSDLLNELRFVFGKKVFAEQWLEEKILREKDLHEADALYVCNSVMGMNEVSLS